MQSHERLARKLSWKLAKVALARRHEEEGRSIDDMPEYELKAAVRTWPAARGL